MLKGLALIGILLSVGIAPVGAKTLATPLVAKRAELKSVQSKISVVDQEVGQLQTQYQAIQRQLALLEKKIGLHATALRDSQRQINEKSLVVSKIEKDIHIQTERVKQQKKILKNQLLAAYHSGQQGHLKLALKQAPALSGRLLNYYDYLNKVRLQNVKRLEAVAKPLVFMQQEQKQTLELLQQQQQSQKTEQAHLAEIKQSRAVLLQQLHSQMSKDNKLLRQLKSNEHALKLLLGKLQQEPKIGSPRRQMEAEKAGTDEEAEVFIEPPPKEDVQDGKATADSTIVIGKPLADLGVVSQGKRFGQLKGHLAWPVAGSIHKRTVGEQINIERGGVLIDAPEGSPVHAVAGGHVVYAGWMRGYGLLTIVNHGDGFMTVYAFNQNLYKKVGSQVNAGEVIASVGQSGGQSNDGLYFEIRKRGQPLPPEAWCKK